jgi:hypothetical protein
VTPGNAPTFAFLPVFCVSNVFAYLFRKELIMEDFPTLGMPAIRNTAGIVLNFLKNKFMKLNIPHDCELF